MDGLVGLLISYGDWGMFIAALLAGSILPFSSEAVMTGLMLVGVPPIKLFIYGTLGNAIGSMLNYYVGRLGKMEWIEKYLHIKKAELDKAHRFMAGRGAWMGFFAFLPVLGEGITVVLGLMKANVTITTVSVTIGKALRYALLIYGTSFFM